jgi:hypothetical protein
MSGEMEKIRKKLDEFEEKMTHSARNMRTVRYCRWSKVVNGVKESLSVRHALHL